MNHATNDHALALNKFYFDWIAIKNDHIQAKMVYSIVETDLVERFCHWTQPDIDRGMRTYN